MRPRRNPRNLSPETKALRKIIKLIGSKYAIGKHFNIAPQNIDKWLQLGIPAERVVALEQLTDGKVKRYEIRPDLYPKD